MKSMKSCSLLKCLHSPDCDWNLWLLWRAAVVTSALSLMIETVKEELTHQRSSIACLRSKFYSLWNSWKLYKQMPVCSSWYSELVDPDNCSGFGEVLGYVIELIWLQKLQHVCNFHTAVHALLYTAPTFSMGK